MNLYVTQRRYSDVNTITLFVGESKTVFYVHEDLLCRYSSLFKAAFSSKFREGSEKTMALPEDEVEIFEMLVDWIYTQQHSIPQSDNYTTEVNARGRALRLLVVSDKYGIPVLKNSICEALIESARARKAPPVADVSTAYLQLPEKSGLRKLLIDWFVDFCQLGWYEKPAYRKWLVKNPDFAADLTAGLAKRGVNAREWSSPLWGPKSAYLKKVLA